MRYHIDEVAEVRPWKNNPSKLAFRFWATDEVGEQVACEVSQDASAGTFVAGQQADLVAACDDNNEQKFFEADGTVWLKFYVPRSGGRSSGGTRGGGTRAYAGGPARGGAPSAGTGHPAGTLPTPGPSIRLAPREYGVYCGRLIAVAYAGIAAGVVRPALSATATEAGVPAVTLGDLLSDDKIGELAGQRAGWMAENLGLRCVLPDTPAEVAKAKAAADEAARVAEAKRVADEAAKQRQQGPDGYTAGGNPTSTDFITW